MNKTSSATLARVFHHLWIISLFIFILLILSVVRGILSQSIITVAVPIVFFCCVFFLWVFLFFKLLSLKRYATSILAVILFFLSVYSLAKTISRLNLLPSITQVDFQAIFPQIANPTPAPKALVDYLSLTNVSMKDGIISGQIENLNDKTVFNVQLQVDFQASQSSTTPAEIVIVTLPATYSSGISTFSQTTSSKKFWPWFRWKIISAEIYQGQPIPTPTPTIKKTKVTTDDGQPWGVAKQIDEVTWTMKVAQEDRIATPQELFDAINTYRQTKGRSKLEWDNRLARYAQTRASYQKTLGKMDKHQGFMDYVNNIDNLKQLGFWSVGENCGMGYTLSGTHLVEWIYAGDPDHDSNQLNPNWTHLGTAVDGTVVEFIFAGERM